MKYKVRYALPIILAAAFVDTHAQERGNDTKIVTFNTGQEVVHNSVVLAPGGYPFGVSGEQIERMERASRQRATQGFVDRGSEYSIAEQVLTHVNQSLSTYCHRRDETVAIRAV